MDFQKPSLHKINGQITAKEVRLIGAAGEQIGILSLSEALKRAEESELDLVEISPTAQPPVCKIMDYRKFLFEKKKKEKEARKKQKVSQLKEIKLSAKISDHDLQHKREHIIKFLADGDKVKISMRFRGRERMYADKGIELMKNFYNTLSEYADIEQDVKLDGANVSMCIIPKKQQQKK